LVGGGLACKELNHDVLWFADSLLTSAAAGTNCRVQRDGSSAGSDKKVVGASPVELAETLFGPVCSYWFCELSEFSILVGLVHDLTYEEKPVSIVCSKCKKSLTVKESILKAHQCGDLRSKVTPRMIRKTGDYVKSHFTELIAAEMRKTLA
jgi:hypothetical protein